MFNNLKKKLSITSVIFLVLFAVAAFLRLYKLQEFIIFLGDQGRDAIIIKRIVTFEHLTAIGPPSSIGQVFLGPFYYYLVAPFLPIFHFNPVGLAYGVVFFSLIGFIAAYFIIKKEVNIRTALFFIFLLAFSSVNIWYSRFSWNPNLLPISAFLTLYFFYKAIETKRWFWAVLTGVFFSISFQFHHLALLLLGPIGIYLVAYTIKHKLNFQIIRNIFLAGCGFVVFISPLILFDIKNCFLNIRSFLNVFLPEPFVKNLFFFSKSCLTNSPFHDKILNDHTPLSNRFLATVTAAFNHTFNLTLPTFAGVILFLIFVGICVYLFKVSKNNFLKLNILNAVLFLLLFSLLDSERHVHYYGVFYYSFLLILSYCLYLLSQIKLLKYTAVPLLLGLYFFFNVQGYTFFYKQPNNQIHDAERIADSIIAHLDKGKTFQTVPLPISVTDHHIRYFLEVKNHRPFDYDSPAEPDELFVMCFYNNPCKIIGNNQWQITVFKNPKVDTMWKLDIVTIYKLVHEKK
jgi:hypothetical protein